MSEYNSNHDSEMLVPLNRRNYVLAIINGIISMMGNRLMHLTTIMPLLLVRLTDKAWTIGLLQALFVIAPALPQLIAARWVDTLEAKRPEYFRWSIYRFLALLALAGSVLMADFIPNVVVAVLVFVFFTARYATQAVSSLCFMDIIGKSVPTTRRGSLWMWRWAGGIALIFLVAVPAIRYMLQDDPPLAFPLNYGALLAAGALVMGIAWLIFSQVDEPESQPARHKLTSAQHFARGLRIWRRDSKFRRMVRIRMLLMGAAAIRPFFIAFGAQVWGLPDAVAATFVTIEAVSQGIGALFAGRLSDRLGNRVVLIFGGATILLTSIGAVLIAQFVPDGSWTILGYDISYRVAALGACFAGGGVFTPMASTGYINYLLDIAPERKRSSYVAFSRAFVVPAGFLPLLFGWLVDAVSYQVVFGIGLLLAAGALVLSLRIQEPRDELSEEELEQFR